MKITYVKAFIVSSVLMSSAIYAADGVIGCDGYKSKASELHIYSGPSLNSHYLPGSFKFKAKVDFDLANWSSSNDWELLKRDYSDYYKVQGPFGGHWNIDSKDNFTFAVGERGRYCAIVKWDRKNYCNNRCFVVQKKPTAKASYISSHNGYVEYNTSFQLKGTGEIDEYASNNSLSYKWNFKDGVSSTERNPTHVYAKAGTYYPSLITNDGDFDSNTSSTPVWVRGPAQPPRSLIYEFGSCASHSRNGILEWERSGTSFQVQVKSGSNWSTIYNGSGTLKSYSTSSTGVKAVRIKASDPTYGPSSNWKTYSINVPACGGSGGGDVQPF